MKTCHRSWNSFALLCLVALASACLGASGDLPDDLAADAAAGVDPDAVSEATAALAAAKTVRVLYVVPSDAVRRDRGPLVANAMEHNRQTWANYGATMTTEPIVTVHSAHDLAWFLTSPDGFHGALREWYWLGNACNAARTVYPEACTSDVNHKYVIFLEANISTVNPGVGAAANFGAAVMPAWIIDGVEQGDLRRIGSIGHELGHTFGMGEPDCDAQGPTKNIMCNGGYYPHNRLNHLDYPFLFTPEHKDYFAETPSTSFDLGRGEVLQGNIWKIQHGMDLEACARSCLSDSQCSTFVHYGTTCEFKTGSLSQTWSVPGYTSAQVKISADGSAIKEAGPIWNQSHASWVCPGVCDIWEGVPWTESSWTGHWWTTTPGQMSVCMCDYNPDVNP